MGQDEGYIKFNRVWNQSGGMIPHDLFDEINSVRKKLFKLGFIGVYPDGISYGNVSIRKRNDNHFYITGTSTGYIENLSREHYTKVTFFDINTNSCFCNGPVQASSESMTHGMFYEMDPAVHGIIHIHNRALWEKLLNKVPTTPVTATFGSVEMAAEVQRLYKYSDLKEKKILAMAGHEEGIICFGNKLYEAMAVLMKYR